MDEDILATMEEDYQDKLAETCECRRVWEEAKATMLGSAASAAQYALLAGDISVAEALVKKQEEVLHKLRLYLDSRKAEA